MMLARMFFFARDCIVQYVVTGVVVICMCVLFLLIVLLSFDCVVKIVEIRKVVFEGTLEYRYKLHYGNIRVK